MSIVLPIVCFDRTSGAKGLVLGIDMLLQTIQPDGQHVYSPIATVLWDVKGKPISHILSTELEWDSIPGISVEEGSLFDDFYGNDDDDDDEGNEGEEQHSSSEELG